MTVLPQPQKLDELLGLLLEQAKQHALIFLDPQGRIIGWLAGAERIFGYTAEEILGQPSSRLFTPEDIERGIPELEVEIASRDGHAEDDRCQIRKDGARFWASGVLVPLRGGDGKLVGFGKVLRNRTNQKARIDALENKIEALTKAASELCCSGSRE